MRKFMFMIIAVVGLLLASCGGKKVVTHQDVFDSIHIGYQQNDSSLSVTKNITLPTEVDFEGVTVNWTSANPAVISNTGVVVRPTENNVTVLLILEVTINGIKEDKTYSLTVLKGETSNEVQYVVSFNTLGGSVVADATVNENALLTAPSAPIKANHTFLGWFKEEQGLTQWDFSKDIVTNNLTLYAKWQADKTTYQVSFETNGGSNVNTQAVVEGEKAFKPVNPTKALFDFEGWYKDESLEVIFDFDVEVVNANITLYAKWVPQKERFSVTFNSNGGSSVLEQVIIDGEKASKPTDPTRGEFTFEGWYQDEALETLYDFETPVTSNITLYAKWKPVIKYYTVSFDSVGGSTVESISVEENTLMTKPNDPTRSSYIFKGWFKDNELINEWDFEEDVVTENITLYASWHPEDVDPDTPIYRVTFESNGGSLIDDQFIAENRAITPLPIPTKDDHTFEGWFKDNEFVTPWGEHEGVTEALTLYAKWKQLPPKLPAPIHGFNVSPDPEYHVGIGPYGEAGGENGGFIGFGFVITNQATNESYTYLVEFNYNQGSAFWLNKENLATQGITLGYGTYKVEYFARGNGETTRDSDVSAQFSMMNVPMPNLEKPVLSIVGTNLTWNDVLNAQSYEVFIDDVSKGEHTSPYDLSDLEPGIYSLKVVAKAEGFNQSHALISYTVENTGAPQLDTPTNLAQDGFNLTWDEVNNAVGYEITMDGVTLESSTNAFDLTLFDKGGATYDVYVVAKGDVVEYANSDAASIPVTLGTLNPRLNAMTAGDMVHTYLKDSIDGGDYKLVFHMGHDVFKQEGFSEKKLLFVLKENGVTLDTLEATTALGYLHRKNNTTDFYGRNNLTYGNTYTIEIILVADEGSDYRNSLPFVTEFVYKEPY